MASVTFTPAQIIIVRRAFDNAAPPVEAIPEATVNAVADKLRDAYTDHPQLTLDLTPNEQAALEQCFMVGAEGDDAVSDEDYDSILGLLQTW